MIDSVLKGTGNSRFLKSAVPAGTSWADALAMLQAGTFPIDFNGINTEGFQQVGTPLNKANLLKDATAAQIGLPPSTTPDGMFQALGNTGELHVWRKIERDASVSAPGYNLGSRTRADICQNTAGNAGDFGVNVEYASEITVDNNGVISLTSPVAIVLKFNGETATFSPTNAANTLKNKFLKIVSVSDDNPSATILKSYKGTVFHCESDFNCYGYGNSSPGYIISLGDVKPVTSYPAGFAYTYPVSTNPNAYQEGDDAKAAGYVVGESKTTVIPIWSGDNTGPFYYGDANTVAVTDDGVVSVQNGTYVLLSRYNTSNTDSLKGKYIQGYPTGHPVTSVYYIPTDATFSNVNGELICDKAQLVTGYAAIPAGTTIEYLGKLGDKARVQVVSYVGTGTYGESNPNSLTFDFAPKVVRLLGEISIGGNFTVCSIYPMNANYGVQSAILFTKALTTTYKARLGFSENNYTNSYCKISQDGRTVTWYNNASDQINTAGYTYYFLALA